jgi:hypothetical protein
MRQNGGYDSTRFNHWTSTERFPVRVSRRSESHEKLIRKEGAARGFLPRNDQHPDDEMQIVDVAREHRQIFVSYL